MTHENTLMEQRNNEGDTRLACGGYRHKHHPNLKRSFVFLVLL